MLKIKLNQFSYEELVELLLQISEELLLRRKAIAEKKEITAPAIEEEPGEKRRR